MLPEMVLKNVKVKSITNAEPAINASGLHPPTQLSKPLSKKLTETRMAKSPGGKSADSSEENTTMTLDKSEKPEEHKIRRELTNGESTEEQSIKHEPLTKLKSVLTKKVSNLH